MKRNSLFLVLLLAALVTLAGCSQQEQSSSENKSSSKGRVVAIDNDAGVLTIDHEEIPNIMMAMTMPFPVEDKKLLEGLAVDDAVAFDVEQKPRLTIVAVRKIDPSELSGKTTSYEGRARVIAVARATGSIMIRAENIPGISSDGDLVYGVMPPTLLEGIEEGDQIEITLEDDGNGEGQLVMTALKKVE